MKAGAGGHEEHRDQEAEADGLELGLERLLGSGRLVGAADDDPGQERAQDGGEPETLGHHGETQREGQRDPGAQLGAGALQPVHHVVQPPPAPQPLAQHHHDRGHGDERGQQLGVRGLAPGGREEERQQDERDELGQRPGGHDQPAELGVGLARVPDDRDQDAQRGGHQDGAQQQAVLDLAAELEPVGDGEGQDGRDDEGPGGQEQHPPVELPQVDLVAGHEEQEAQPEVGDDPDGHVQVDPAQHGRPDQDPAQDLEHDRVDVHGREQPEEQGHDDGDQADDEQAVEGDHDTS
jgi:hypothetical protein